MTAQPSAAVAAVAAPEATAPPRKKPWLLIGIVGAVLLAGGGTAAWLLRAHSAPKTAATVPAPPVGPPLYVPLDPAFVANLAGDQPAHFLQITAQLMTHDPQTVDALKAADPIIRNDLLLLFSNQKATDLSTDEGKEKLHAAALAAVRKVLAANGGKPETVDAVLFTSFVMQ
jgi:flagellar protein FliL